MAILITGGSGLIGASLTRMMIESGARPVVIDIAPVHPILKKWEPHFAYFQGSVDNLPELLNIIKKESIDTIFHLGGMLSMPSEKSLGAGRKKTEGGLDPETGVVLSQQGW
jgi:UDP-glucose 4-epimerase